MNEKPKVQKSCLNCYYFQLKGEDRAYCAEHGQWIPVPDSPDDPDYGYCSDYVYECCHCYHNCCPNHPENVEIV